MKPIDRLSCALSGTRLVDDRCVNATKIFRADWLVMPRNATDARRDNRLVVAGGEQERHALLFQVFGGGTYLLALQVDVENGDIDVVRFPFASRRFVVRVGQPSIMEQVIGGILPGPICVRISAARRPVGTFSTCRCLEGDDRCGCAAWYSFPAAGRHGKGLELALRLRRAAASVSLTGIVIPFAIGFGLGEPSPANFPHPRPALRKGMFSISAQS